MCTQLFPLIHVFNSAIASVGCAIQSQLWLALKIVIYQTQTNLSNRHVENSTFETSSDEPHNSCILHVPHCYRFFHWWCYVQEFNRIYCESTSRDRGLHVGMSVQLPWWNFGMHSSEFIGQNSKTIWRRCNDQCNKHVSITMRFVYNTTLGSAL